MAVYTQIQRFLFEVVPLSEDEVERVVNPCPYPFHHQFKTWGITTPEATRKEFLKYNEIEFIPFICIDATNVYCIVGMQSTPRRLILGFVAFCELSGWS
jgi:hypothetical protein